MPTLHTFAVLQLDADTLHGVDVIAHYKNIDDANKARESMAQANPYLTFTVIILPKAK